MLGTKGTNSLQVDWQTPKTGNFGKGDWGLVDLKKEFKLTLDPCAPVEAKQDSSLSCCSRFYTKEEDGLKQDWKENAFVNPIFTPASVNPDNNIELWIRKGIIESQRWGTTNVYLLPSYTGAYWWHDFVLTYGVIRYIRGRMKYWKNGAPWTGSPNIDSVVVFFSHPDPNSYPWSKQS